MTQYLEQTTYSINVKNINIAIKPLAIHRVSVRYANIDKLLANIASGRVLGQHWSTVLNPLVGKCCFIGGPPAFFPTGTFTNKRLIKLELTSSKLPKNAIVVTMNAEYLNHFKTIPHVGQNPCTEYNGNIRKTFRLNLPELSFEMPMLHFTKWPMAAMLFL